MEGAMSASKMLSEPLPLYVERIRHDGSSDRWQREMDRFDQLVETFCEIIVPAPPRGLDAPASMLLQRRMLAQLLRDSDLQGPFSPAYIGDAVGERNRRHVREAGRALVAKGVIIADSNPDDGPEGEHVVGYRTTEAIEYAFDAHVDDGLSSFEAEVAAASKQ
jgi:hypothetical protein